MQIANMQQLPNKIYREILFDYLTEYDILNLVCVNHDLRDEFFLEIYQVRLDRSQCLQFLRNAAKLKELLGRMTDSRKQISVNKSKEIFQDLDESLSLTNKNEFLQSLKQYPVYSLIPPKLSFPSLSSLTIEYEFFFFICEMSKKNRYNFTVQTLDLFKFSSVTKPARAAIADWIDPYLCLATKSLSISSWPLKRTFPKLSSMIETLSLMRCVSIKLNHVPSLQTLVLRETTLTNLQEFSNLKVLELSHQYDMKANDIPKVKKLILRKCVNMRNLGKIKGIEEVQIEDCNITNYCNLFRDVKRLSIDVTEIRDDYSDSEDEDDDRGFDSDSDEENDENSEMDDHSNSEDGEIQDNDDNDDDEFDSSNNEEDSEVEEDDVNSYDDQDSNNELFLEGLLMMQNSDNYYEPYENDDDAYDYPSSEDIFLDLSHYSQLERVFISVHEIFVSGSLISNGLAKTVKAVDIRYYYGPLNISDFTNLNTLKIIESSEVTSLVGLGNVRRLTLTRLSELTSLSGLGGSYNGSNSDNRGNQYVEVSGCDRIVDFSPLKHVKEVYISDCQGFRNGFDVDHVHTLTLSSCNDIIDISMLHRVERLKITYCDRITSLEGLENIRDLSYSNCRHLELRHHKEPVYKKDYGVRITLDLLTSLPDSLYPEILKYLRNQDQLSVIHCNCYLYQRLIRKYRQFKIEEQNDLDGFFTDSLYREKILDRVEDSSNQLELLQLFEEDDDFGFELFNTSHDLTVCCPNGWSRIKLPADIFLSLIEAYPNAFPKTINLELFTNLDLDSDRDEKAIHSLNTININNLILKSMRFPPSIQLPITLNQLTINNSPFLVKDLLYLPHLKSLTIQNSLLSNISDFTYVEKLVIKEIQTSFDVTVVKNVKELHLINCWKIRNMITLQDNEVIVIEFPNSTEYDDLPFYNNANDNDRYNNGLIDLSHCFVNSKTIELEFHNDENQVNIDLSYYDKVEHFTIRGNAISLLDGASEKPIKKRPLRTKIPSFYSNNIPSSLKVLRLNGIKNLISLGNGNFKHLQSIEIADCEKFKSLVGLGNIPSVRLSDLPNLASLEGLSSNQKVFLSFLHVTDFSPLKNVKDLTLLSCPNLTSTNTLTNVKRLLINDCSQLSDLKGMKQLEQLALIGCDNVKSMKGLKGNVKLLVTDCSCLDDFDGYVSSKVGK